MGIQSKLEQIVQTVNEIKRKRESMDQMNVLTKRLSVKGFTLLKPNRFLVHSCEELIKIGAKRKPKTREIYVFNDIIVHLEKSKTSNKDNSIINLHNSTMFFPDKFTEYTIEIKNSEWKDSKKNYFIFLFILLFYNLFINF